MVVLAHGAVGQSDPGRVDLQRPWRTRGEEAPRVTISHVRLLDA